MEEEDEVEDKSSCGHCVEHSSSDYVSDNGVNRESQNSDKQRSYYEKKYLQPIFESEYDHPVNENDVVEKSLVIGLGKP